MFGLFETREKRMRDNASNWLEMASKVWSLRRDRIEPRDAEELASRRNDLARLLGERSDAAKLKLAIEALESVLSRVGGPVYPRSSLSENVEFVLVAAIVVLGIRTYFIQPFKIPTNSMWPTYHGMKAENLPPSAPAPGPLGRLAGLVTLGAQRRTIVAPADGEVSVPLIIRGDTVIVGYTVRPGRTWLVFPTKVRVYTVYVGGVPASVTVPTDLDNMDDVILGTFFPDRAALAAQIAKARRDGSAAPMQIKIYDGRNDLYDAERVPVGRSARSGEPVVRFDLLAGDQLLVDRFSFNFVRPTVGQGFVFRSDDIPGIMRVYGAEFLIKRLAGQPGDRIEVRDPVLLRNGSPITGSEAFDLNARKVSPYRGYANARVGDPGYSQLFPGQVITVPDRDYLALGDNSRNSFDGRYWGFVPAEDVVGRPLVIYWPFSSRWGAAK
ncbi:MAG TPA: signal peptidase I [Opitutaceae bacterium]|jgi:signal peptidase I